MFWVCQTKSTRNFLTVSRRLVHSHLCPHTNIPFRRVVQGLDFGKHTRFTPSPQVTNQLPCRSHFYSLAILQSRSHRVRTRRRPARARSKADARGCYHGGDGYQHIGFVPSRSSDRQRSATTSVPRLGTPRQPANPYTYGVGSQTGFLSRQFSIRGEQEEVIGG